MNEAQQILSVLIKESVQTKFEQKIDAVIEEKYSAKKEVKEQDEEENEENIEESDDDEDDDDEDDDDEDDDDEELEESMKVEYLEKGAYQSGKKGKKTETTTINRHADLVKMANTGKYEWFMVTKKDGTEVEYTVDFEGKKPVLVEM